MKFKVKLLIPPGRGRGTGRGGKHSHRPYFFSLIPQSPSSYPSLSHPSHLSHIPSYHLPLPVLPTPSCMSHSASDHLLVPAAHGFINAAVCFIPTAPERSQTQRYANERRFSPPHRLPAPPGKTARHLCTTYLLTCLHT
ncbi:hypothetical protein E2C01_071524 [Portunus trituberculatus]|uniref:Uncharacterized protein n=1 Tax=Portunus trituberculatus TaxID=210409 RepID=A0A5B7I5C1_PORTR|nr:hypothetical protein [Portunus trituberculatus]